MKKNYILEDLDCANCAAKIEEGVKNIEGVTDCSVSFVTEKMIVEIEEGKEEVVEKEIKKVVRKIEPDTTLKEVFVYASSQSYIFRELLFV